MSDQLSPANPAAPTNPQGRTAMREDKEMGTIEHELAELRKALDARPTSWQLFWVIVLAGIAISAATEIMRGLAS